MLGDFARVTHPVRLAELFYVGRDQRLIVGIGGIVRLTDYPQDISRLWIRKGVQSTWTDDGVTSDIWNVKESGVGSTTSGAACVMVAFTVCARG